MSTLFTLFFPEYYFVVLEPRTLSFDPKNLPFEVIDDTGNLYIWKLVSNDYKIEWQNRGLQAGLRIIQINGIDLADILNPTSPQMTKDKWTDILCLFDDQISINITFKEEIHSEQSSIC